MGGLVDDLLALARFDQGRPLTTTQVDLAVIGADAAADARAKDPEREVVLDADGPVVVEADEAKVRQIAANLVGNALVHTPSSATIWLRVGRDGDRGWLEVVDSGPGMSPDVAARAFERFYRADPARSRHHGGSGLGLSIVDATVRAYGGTVSLDSQVARGTRVRVELPTSPAGASGS